MSESEFIDAVKNFLTTMGRLPYLSEDDIRIVEIKDGKEINRDLRAGIRIDKFYGSYDNFLEKMFELDIISLEKLENMTSGTVARISNIMNQSVKNPDQKLRREIHYILGIDFYADKLTPYHVKCQGCKKGCKQHYYVDLYCPNSIDK